jgi:nucleolar protein 56
MGSDINEIDLINVKYFTDKVDNLMKYRHELLDYLTVKMNKLAPNVSALIGETVGARLISHAGGLASLAKYPASTIQILGAEKALFRALKTRGKTPKYGILYHTSFIGKASIKNKGKISRYIANKLAVCARIDYFTTERFDDYGKELKNQIEERLTFLNNGEKPRKNLDVMKKIHDLLQNKPKEDELLKKKKKKETKPVDSDDEEEEKPKKKKKVADSDDEEEEKPKKKKKVVDSDDEEEKPKKKKKVVDSDDEEEEKPKKKKKVVDSDDEEEEKPKKKKKTE